jgi:ABC-type transport system substrate-binding protein
VTGGRLNRSLYSNPEFDRLFQEQSLYLDPARRQNLVYQMQSLLHTEVPRVVLYWDVEQAQEAAWYYLREYHRPESIYARRSFSQVWLNE